MFNPGGWGGTGLRYIHRTILWSQIQVIKSNPIQSTQVDGEELDLHLFCQPDQPIGKTDLRDQLWRWKPIQIQFLYFTLLSNMRYTSSFWTNKLELCQKPYKSRWDTPAQWHLTQIDSYWLGVSAGCDRFWRYFFEKIMMIIKLFFKRTTNKHQIVLGFGL